MLACCIPGHAQLAADSKDGFFVAYGEKPHHLKPPLPDTYGSEIKIFSTALSAHIQSIFVTQTRQFDLDTIYLSPKGGLIVVRIKTKGMSDYGYLYNTLTAKPLAEVGWGSDLVAFLPDDSHYFLRQGNAIAEINARDKKKVNEYKFNEQERLTKLYVTTNEKYLIGQTPQNTWVWELHTNKAPRKYRSDAHAYDEGRGIITFYASSNNDLVCTSILVSGGRIISKYKLSGVMKKLDFRLDSIHKSQTRGTAQSKKAVLVIQSESAKLSPAGNFIAFECGFRGEEKKAVVVVNNVTKDFRLYEQTEPIKPSYTWAGDSSFLLRKNSREYLLGNPRNEKLACKLQTTFELEKSKGEHAIQPEKQAPLWKWSSDYRYVVLSDKHKGADRVYLHPTLIKQQKSVVDSAVFVGFGQNNAAVYILGDGNHFGYVNTEDVEGDVGDKPLAKTFFTDSLIIPIQGEIINDPIPPPGYYFPKITSFKHISEATTSTPLHIYLKTMMFDGNTNSLQVHLIDTNGVYYYGASEAAWKKIWCNLLLYEPEKVRQITDFSVTEYREDTSFYNALCVALDFSGSMGAARGHNLQKGLLKLIDTKLQHEGIAVVKYDSRVVDECNLTTDKTLLTQNMSKTPYEKMASATALLDALDHAIDLLKASADYENKFIILLTDGCENASLVTKKYVIEKAIQNNIRIFTIGLGEYVSEGYLKSIAHNTQGSYYRIYNSENLDWIYQDVRNKIKNYYTIKFKTEKDNPGYKAILNICLDKKYTDTLTVQFDNSPILAKLKKAKRKSDKIESPFDQVENPQTDLYWKDVKIMEDCSQITTTYAIPEKLQQHPKGFLKTMTRTDSVVEEAFNALEFPAIKFEFDKTIIVKGTDDGIDNVVKFMKEHPKLRIEVQGHTDNKGADEHNIPLSLARADVVKAVLVGEGIPAERMTAKGYGSTQPLVPNDSEENRQINRRIDFKIVGN